MNSFRRFVPAVLLVAAITPAAGPPAATAAGEPSPTLVRVGAVHRSGTDRIAFQFEGGMPSAVQTQYVPRLLADGSGRPIRIAGRAILQVTFHGTETTSVIPAPKRRAFALPNVMTTVRSGLFEGVTSYGIGLAKETQVRVLEQPDRQRVVIEVRAAFRTVQRKVWFFDEDRFVAGHEPYFVPRLRPVLASAPATGVMDRLFAGPLPRGFADGLRLVRSHAKGFARLRIEARIARLRLTGGCDSGGSTVTIAGEIMPSLRQFDTVDWVKIADPAGHTADPTGPSDSIPECLNP